MSPVSKRQQTQAKRNREHAVQEKRTLKQEKKRAAAAAARRCESGRRSPRTSPMAEGNPGREN
jgi:hypothetical protein